MRVSVFGRDLILFEARGSVLQTRLDNPDATFMELLGGSSTDAGVVVTEQTALRISAVYACVRVLSDSIAQLPLVMYRRDGERNVRATDHPLYEILHERPNREMTSFSFRKAMQTALALRGNAYAEIERDRLGRVVALYPIPWDQHSTWPERDASGAIVYKVRDLRSTSVTTLPAEKVLHLMGLSVNGLVGLSPIQEAKQALGITMAAEEYGARFFGAGANVGGILKHPGKLSKEAGDKLRQNWKSLYEGLKRSNRTAILEEGMSYERVGLPPGDAQFLEVRKFGSQDIARIYGVPLHMIGELDRATWSNMEQQSIEFVVHTLGPWFENWEESIEWKLLSPQERKQYYVEFSADAFLRGDTQTRYAAYQTGRQNGWLSANDIRRLENMDPIEGGDIYLVPLNMVPADQAGSRPPVKEPGTRALPAPEAPTEKRAEPDGPEARRQLGETYAPVFRDALSRIFRRERADVLRQAGKQVDDDALIDWLQEYYDEHPGFAAKTILPALESYADAVGRTTQGETGQEWTGLTDELRTFLAEYSDTFGTRTSISSRMRTGGTVRDAAAAGQDRTEALTGMFDEWDAGRVSGDTDRETNQAANAVVKTVLAAAGVQVLRWSASGSSCPLCQRMHGKIVSITETFVNVGDVIDGGEGQEPMTVQHDLGHPPLHGGCRCQITAG